MKKLLQWVLPAFIGIVPALGMDQLQQELTAGQRALNQPNTIYSVARTWQKGPDDLIAFVSVTPQNGDPKVVKVKSIFNKIDIVDQIDEKGAYGQEIGELVADYDGTMLCEKYTKPQILRYNEVSSPLLTASINHTPVIEPFLSLKIIPFGVVVDFCQEGQYERPDRSIFKTKNGYRVIAKGFHKGAQLTTLDQFFGLDFDTLVDVRSTRVESGDDATVSESDPVLYQILIKKYLYQPYSGWECEDCHGGGHRGKTYHTAVGYDYAILYKQLMIRLHGKEDILYPNSQLELKRVKKTNGKVDRNSSEHNPPKTEFTKEQDFNTI